MIYIFLSILWTAGIMTCVLLTWKQDGTGMHHGKKASRHRQCDALGNVLLGEFWLYVDVTLTCTTNLNIVAAQVHLLMATVFPNGSGIFQRNNAPCYTAQIIQNWSEEHDREFNSDQVRSTEAPLCNLQDLMNLLLTSLCHIQQHTFRCLVEVMPWPVRSTFATTHYYGKSFKVNKTLLIRFNKCILIELKI